MVFISMSFIKQLLSGITWRSPILNFTQTGWELWKAQEEINLNF
jgi:hypothetical protein